MIYKTWYRDVPQPQVPYNQQVTQGLQRGDQYLPGGLEVIQIGSGDSVFSVDPQGMWLGNRKFANAPFKVNMAGQLLLLGGDSGWNPTNVTTDKVFDADATSTAELADVLGTLINLLKYWGLISG